MRDGRFGDGAEHERRHGDAELGGGEHGRDVLEAPDDRAGSTVTGFRARFDLAAPHGDQGELAADEEVVRHEGERTEDELQRGHNCCSPASSSASPTWAGLGPVISTRSATWCATVSTSNSHPSM